MVHKYTLQKTSPEKKNSETVVKEDMKSCLSQKDAYIQIKRMKE